MSIFLILPLGDEDERARAREILTPQLTQLGSPVQEIDEPLAWFAAYDGTTRELATALGLTSGDIRGVVLSIKYYQGFAPRSLWEWLDTHRTNGH